MNSTSAVEVSIQAVSAPDIVSARARGEKAVPANTAEHKTVVRENRTGIAKDLKKSADECAITGAHFPNIEIEHDLCKKDCTSAVPRLFCSRPA
jgi:hypothetical protein